MNLRHLEVFKNVMQIGSIKGAAEIMCISEAATSKLLSNAERKFGIKLFERTRGRLIPTPEGRKLYDDVQTLWNHVEYIEGVVQRLAQSEGDKINVGISPSLGVTVIPKVATALTKENSKLEMSIELLIPHLLIQSLVDGIIDIAISLNPQEHPNLQILKSYPCRMVCVMPKTHPLAHLKKIYPENLSGHSVVSFPQGTNYGIADEDLYGEYKSMIHKPISVRSGQTACWFSQAGGGVAIVDETTIVDDAFPFLAIKPYICNAKLNIYILKHKNRPLSKSSEILCTTFEKIWLSQSERLII